MIAHLFRYRVAPGHEGEFVAFVRHVGHDAAVATPGLVAVSIGRRLGRQGQEHVALSVWDGPDSERAGLDAQGVPRFLAPRSNLLYLPRSERYDLVGQFRGETTQPRLLRIYRAVLDQGLEAWFRRQVDEVAVELARRHGAVFAFVGLRHGVDSGTGPPDGGAATPADPAEDSPTRAAHVFVATGWSSWETVLASTGGRVDRPVVNAEHEAQLHDRTIEHFEVIEAEEAPPVPG